MCDRYGAGDELRNGASLSLIVPNQSQYLHGLSLYTRGEPEPNRFDAHMERESQAFFMLANFYYFVAMRILVYSLHTGCSVIVESVGPIIY